MPTIKIIPSINFDNQLKIGVGSNILKEIDGRLAINVQEIFERIGDYLVGVFEQTDVVKSLRGNGSIDLPAHFGLSDALANELVGGMSLIIANSVILGSTTKPGGGSLTIKAVSTDWEKYTNLPGAKYISQPSNVEVPVIEWMLLDPSKDIGQAAYEIVFGGGKFDAQINKVSRSGRAIMVSLSSLGGSGKPYVLPGIISQQAGENFIAFAIGQPGVAQKAAEILINRITK